MNWNVIFLNFTYQTNCYYIFLYIIIVVIDLNTSFYIGFIFISSKIYIDYYQVLFCIQKFYIEGDISDTIFAETNYEKALIQVLEFFFS